MVVLTGADLVLPDRIVSGGTVAIDGGRIVEVTARTAASAGGRSPVHAFPRHYLVPGFIDVHVHGIEGVDTLDERDGGSRSSAVAAMAATLPRYGVTAFCPTTIACDPEALARVLASVRLARADRPPHSARVLPAHLESNFINPDFRGAQPLACLRRPRAALAKDLASSDSFPASALLDEITRAAADVGIVTLAPELEGGMELIGWLTARGHRVSLGHSAATFEQGLEAIGAGARHATHLFNRMPPLAHRAPGLAGAILHSEEVGAELICDGYHVHPAMLRTAVAVKGPSRVMAITDGTALSGLPPGSRGLLGGHPIVARESAAFLADGTMAGSVLTMDRAFRMLVRTGFSLIDAATMGATTPARELGLAGLGVIAEGAAADLVVLDRDLAVVRTYVAGELAYSRVPPG
jgi:N-acetylglucosamine-6-phosphate deacetylase